MDRTMELAELKRIRELLEFQMLDPLQQRLEQVIENNKDKRILWIMSDGKTPFTEIITKLSVKRAAAYNYLTELKYHNLIKDRDGFPTRVVDFIPGKWGDLEKLLAQNLPEFKEAAEVNETRGEPNGVQKA